MTLQFAERQTSIYITLNIQREIIEGLLIFCLFHFTLPAQENFDPCYIINYNRDTVKGFIKAAVEEDLNVTVRFKKEINGELKDFGPADLLGFVLGNRNI